MLRVIGCITEQHDPTLVFVAACLCIAGSWAAVVLLSRARSGEVRTQNVWIFTAAAVFGLSVWATHFIAMLGFRSALPMAYRESWTALSIVLSVGINWIGFWLAVRKNWTILGGAIVGGGIGVMHYVGMAALEGPFHLAWNPYYVAASLLGGVFAAACSLKAGWTIPARFAKAVQAALLTLSVCTVHFVAMTAVAIVPDPTMSAAGEVFPPAALAIAVSAVAVLIIVLGTAGAYLDLYLEIRRGDERARLKAHIKELEATKRELGFALETASAANKSKSAFLATMSHELRTPLNAIIGFAELMAAEAFGPLGNDRYKGYNEDIGKAGAHLLSIINEILDLSRLEAGKVELEETEVALPQLLAEASAMMEARAKDNGIALTLVCPPGLPRLKADDRRVKQVVLNLLSNAVKFTPKGGAVALTAALRDGAVFIAVTDTGIGIAKEDLPKAFESFSQIDNRLSRKFEGSGLGLPLARHLVELHGGRLDLESELHHGTTATVLFPRDRSIREPERRAA
ncbi:MAG TPA: MHYT domain-containing protein [Rhizomicrobium sp.]|jgi:signal transduction histidine kinase